MSNNQTSFMPVRSTVRTHRIHHFSQKERYDKTFTAFSNVRNQRKKVCENAKSRYALAVQGKVENKKRGSYKFWYISNTILKSGKPSGPSIINAPAFISSTSDNAKVFAINFVSRSTLEELKA